MRRLLGSVRVRVALVAGFAFAVTLIAASVLLLRTLETRLIDDVRESDASALQDQAMHILTSGLPEGVALDASATGATGPAGSVSFVVPGPTGRPFVAQAGSAGQQTAFDTLIVDGRAQFGTGALPAAYPFDPESARLLGISAGTGPFLVSTVRVSQDLSLSTASSLAEVGRTLDTTRTVLWYAVPALVLLVCGLAWLLVGRALRPVHALTSRASTISAESLHDRVPVPPVADEVSELATTINSMLDRIEAADLASRRLVSDASHELRTPITVMRTELEVARRDPGASWPDVSANLLIEVERLQALVDDLLLLARMSERGRGEPTASEPFELIDTVRDVTARKRRADVCTTLAGEDAAPTIVGDAAAMRRALDHVVANAARHAAARVRVEVEAPCGGNGAVTIHVDDDGPGIPATERARVVERFERLDEGRSRDAGGSGLGLAVAVDVLAAHGGSLSIADSPLGGARVSLTVPVGAIER